MNLNLTFSFKHKVINNTLHVSVSVAQQNTNELCQRMFHCQCSSCSQVYSHCSAQALFKFCFGTFKRFMLHCRKKMVQHYNIQVVDLPDLIWSLELKDGSLWWFKWRKVERKDNQQMLQIQTHHLEANWLWRKGILQPKAKMLCVTNAFWDLQRDWGTHGLAALELECNLIFLRLRPPSSCLSPKNTVC